MPDDTEITESEFEIAKAAAKKLKDSTGDTSGHFTPDIEADDIPK